MSMKITPTSEEIKLKENDFITSKTDLKGKITYCNESFIYFSGYEEADLIGQPHNIIRHPDMPRAVYRMMWENLQKQQEFFGIIKNLSKNGAYYWTFANVSSSFDEKGKPIGYYSVRRHASPQIINLLTPIYKEMVAEEGKHNNSNQAMDTSIQILNDLISDQQQSYSEFIYTHA
ncbi:MAG: PAS domain-containing protein [Methylophaga sp.]|nr:PAS domain-containing protein [Methylophaga sp.]